MSHNLSTKAKSDIAYAEFSKIFDKCSVHTFNEYKTKFATWYYICSISQILLSAIGAILSGMITGSTGTMDTSTIDMITMIILGVTSVGSIIGTILHTTKLHVAMHDCNVAYSNLQFYLSSKKPMPQFAYDQITQANTLCYKQPSPCRHRGGRRA